MMNVQTTPSSTSLAIELGKYKSVACVYDQPNGRVRFETFDSNRAELGRLLAQAQPSSQEAGDRRAGPQGLGAFVGDAARRQTLARSADRAETDAATIEAAAQARRSATAPGKTAGDFGAERRVTGA